MIASVSSALAENFDQLEASIKNAENRVPNLIAGTEKTIRWYNGQRQKTPFSIIYLHGFSATHREISPVPEALADKLGANVFFSRLRGHGRDGDAMLDGTIDAWLEDTKEAYSIASQLGEQVIVIGTSTGATLSTWLSAQSFADNMVANIMVSPNFGVASDQAWIMQWSLGLWLVKKLTGEYRGFEPQNDFHAKYWTERYPVDALVPMLDLVDMVNDLDKSTITIPQLMIYSPQDSVINVENAEQTIKSFSQAETESIAYTDSIDPGHHVLFGYGSSAEQIDAVSELMLQFVQSKLGDPK